LSNYPWVDGTIYADYGYNLKYVFSYQKISELSLICSRIGDGVYINNNSTWIDTCIIEVGARTLIGPNCSFFSGTHPLDPFVRNGTSGPESGKPIKIGEDCWFGGNCIVLPGVTIGRGVTVGAGSVVTKDVPDYVVVAGNPARILKKIDINQNGNLKGSEVLVGEHTEQAEKTS
jgi:acetyltransferase-like isoleucine patch superfamily enzyme